MKKRQQNANKKLPRSTIVRGEIRYIDEYKTASGKRVRKFYKTEQELSDAKAARNAIRKSELSAVIDKKFPPETVVDIGAALKLLPEGMTLAQCVEIAAKQRIPSKDAEECLKEFFNSKIGKVSPHYLATSQTRVKRYLDSCGGFSGVSAESLIAFLKKVSSSEKSRKHYAMILREFFDWCNVREYYRDNPFSRLHQSDLPVVLPKARSRVPVERIKAFFADCEKSAPEFAGIFALVAFGGLRMSEAQKLSMERVNINRKEITVPFNISKTGARIGRNFLQTQMPDNLWKWLEKYPLPRSSRHLYDKIDSLGSWKTLPNNALRHSFATYHLSLYRAADKTAILMRHSSAQLLWSIYLDELTSESEAAEYFAIVPGCS